MMLHLTFVVPPLGEIRFATCRLKPVLRASTRENSRPQRSAIPRFCCVFLAIALTITSAPLSAEEQYRTWHMSSGRKTRIKLAAIDIVGSKVVFKREDDGRTFQFPIRNLRQDHQEVLRQQFSKSRNPFRPADDRVFINPANGDEIRWPAPVLNDQNLQRWTQFIQSDPQRLGVSEEVRGGGIRLTVTVRDLPRGNIIRPGDDATQRTAYHQSRLDLTASEVSTIVGADDDRHPLPQPLLLKFAAVMKDNVRGDCRDWTARELKSGSLLAERLSRNDGQDVIRLTGRSDLRADGRSYHCQLHGRVVWNRSDQQIESFTLIASGQRSGGTAGNGRSNDLGPAPMGVAFQLQKKTRPLNLESLGGELIEL